jgi:hypothetical protein
MSKTMNKRFGVELNLRSEKLRSIANAIPAEQNLVDAYLQSLEYCLVIPKTSLPTYPSHLLAKLVPLEECVAAIIYEATISTHSRSIITDGRPEALGNTVTLLRCAARHQAVTENVNSLISPIIQKWRSLTNNIRTNLLPSPLYVYVCA